MKVEDADTSKLGWFVANRWANAHRSGRRTAAVWERLFRIVVRDSTITAKYDRPTGAVSLFRLRASWVTE